MKLIADINFYPQDKSGREHPVMGNNKYRPHIFFDENKEFISIAGFNILNGAIAKPGDCVIAEVTLISPEHLGMFLKVDGTFHILEAGENIVGEGKILYI